MPLISAAEAASLRSDLAVVLVHTCTITPSTEGPEDSWGDAADTPGTPRTGVPCLYVPEDRLLADATGRVTQSGPTLTLDGTDPIAVGDRVSDVRDAGGTVRLAGPVTVDADATDSALGYALQRRVVLGGARVVE